MVIQTLVKNIVGGWGPAFDPYECRHCGRSFGEDHEECPSCGGSVTRIVIE